LDIVKYIIDKMNIDIGLSMSLIISYEDNDEVMQRLFPNQFKQMNSKQLDANSSI